MAKVWNEDTQQFEDNAPTASWLSGVKEALGIAADGYGAYQKATAKPKAAPKPAAPAPAPTPAIPPWVKPLAIGAGVLVALAIVFKMFKAKG